jgi:Disulphide bond corrector protein DsbC
MNKSIISFLLMAISLSSFAQPKSPVSWAFSAKKLGANKYELKMTANIGNNWHLYSQKTPEGGPEATAITFSPNALVTNTGTPKEVGKLVKKHDESFGVDVMYYSNKVDFVQNVTVKGSFKTNVSGKVYFMVCDDSKCLPPTEVPFSIALK